MVRIVELMEAETDFVPLKPGDRQHVPGTTPVNYALKKDLNNAHRMQKNAETARIALDTKWKWDNENKKSIEKTPDDVAADRKNYRIKRTELNNATKHFADDVKNAIPFIQKHCSKYLPIFQSHGFIYRGFDTPDFHHPVFYGYPRKNRMPVDSNPHLQETFDEILYDMHIDARRSNSIFCTSSEITARAYGMQYVIIPCNDAKYAWSTMDPDIILSSQSEEEHQLEYNTFLEDVYAGEYPDEKIRNKKFQKLFGITTKNMDSAIDEKHEVWITGHYVAVMGIFQDLLKQLLFGDKTSG